MAMTRLRTLVVLILAQTFCAQIARAEAPGGAAFDNLSWTLIDVAGQTGVRDAQITLKLQGMRARAAGLSCFELAGPVEHTPGGLSLQGLKLRHWAACRGERQSLVNALHQAFQETARYAMVDGELWLMSAATELLARFTKDKSHVFGTRSWTMTSIAGAPGDPPFAHQADLPSRGRACRRRLPKLACADRRVGPGCDVARR
jgi:hypothetical protein